MSENMTDNKIYNKLTPERKRLVDMVLVNLESGAGLWKQGWVGGAPISAITGKPYSGVNRLFLTAATMAKGYTDNRWLTYNQMKAKGWHFKQNAEGESLGPGSGVAIEYYELRDRETKKPFDRHTLDGMTKAEQEEYMDENVYSFRKYYRVFNGDIIEGIPERVKPERDESGYSERAEKMINAWSDTEAKIYYGGPQAYYVPDTDEIHIPNREAFYGNQEFYSTTLHEIGHSTGHKSRLNRDLSGKFGTADYAVEELRAEIASMFIAQDLELEANESHIQNNSAYIQHWKSKITENPNVLFTAIADAERITKLVMAKEKVAKSEAEETEDETLTDKSEQEPQPVAPDNAVPEEPKPTIEEMAANTDVEYVAFGLDEDDEGESVYKVYRVYEQGFVKRIGDYSVYDDEEKAVCLERIGRLPEYKGKTLQEVSPDELQAISTYRYERQKEKMERLAKIEADKSEVYLPPSEAAGVEEETVAAVVAVDMAGRGVESLTNMDDRDIVERAGKTKHGDKFMALFNGETPLKEEEQNERSLMSRIIMQTGKPEQVMRIFKASGQYRDSKPNSYYERMLKEEIKFIEGLRSKMPVPPATQSANKSRFSNAKS